MASKQNLDAVPAAAQPQSAPGPSEATEDPYVARGYDLNGRAAGHPDFGKPYVAPPPKPKRAPRKKKAPPSAPEPDMIAVHNLTEGNLAHAYQMGGLAAPSLAVVNKTAGMDNFGEVTLVAPHHLIDPEQNVPVFDADIYSPRYPSTRNKVNEKHLARIQKWLRPHVEATGGYTGDLSDTLEKEGVERAAHGSRVRPALMSAWLAEQGRPVDPVMVTGKVDQRYEWVKQPAMREFLRQHPDGEPDTGPDDPARVEYHRAFSEAARKAVEQHGQQLGEALEDPEFAESYKNRFLHNFFNDDGTIHYGALSGAQRAGAEMDKTVVDPYATSDALKAKVEELGVKNFEKWAKEKLAPAQGDAYIPRYVDNADGGTVRRIPYTLDNVLKEMTRKIRAGEDFNYGIGTARSFGAKRFRSLDELKQHRGRIVSTEEMKKVKEDNDKRFGELADQIGRYHHDPGGFRVLEGLSQAIGDSYRRGKYLYKELEANGFRGVPADLRQKISEFAADLIAQPSEYFEAKPQRIVHLHEFAGAAIPHDASPETREILRHHGITNVHEYQRGQPAERAAAVERAAKSKDLMLSEREVDEALAKADR